MVKLEDKQEKDFAASRSSCQNVTHQKVTVHAVGVSPEGSPWTDSKQGELAVRAERGIRAAPAHHATGRMDGVVVKLVFRVSGAGLDKCFNMYGAGHRLLGVSKVSFYNETHSPKDKLF